MPQLGGHRRLLTGLAVAGSAALLFTSASFACTLFKGKMTMQGNKGTGVVTALGANGDMLWCPGYPKGKAKATLGGSVTINVTKAGYLADGCTSRDKKLPAAVYDVNYSNGKAFTRTDPTDKDNTDNSRRYAIDCMTIVDSLHTKRYETIGAMTIDSLGKGTGTYQIPTTSWDGSPGVISGPTDEAAVCVSGRDGQFGLQAPLTIV